MRRPRHLAPALAASMALAACAPGGPSSPAADETLGVVASTNVYGDIAATIGGDAVAVTSIVSEPSQDPHSYEGDTRSVLSVSEADVVIENGGGYDDFIDRMLASGDSDPVVLNAVDIAGYAAAAGAEPNEHVWYDVVTMSALADEIAAALGDADAANADTYARNAEAFDEELTALVGQQEALRRRHAGEPVGITEPVPVYLLEAIGLDIVTPEAFSEAIEEGDDVSVAVLQETLRQYRDHEVEALVLNEQTSGPITDQVGAAAEEAGVPVVPVTETLPEGETYLSWMKANLDSIGSALEQ